MRVVDWELVRSEYDSGLSLYEICVKHQYTKCSIDRGRKQHLNIRTRSQASTCRVKAGRGFKNHTDATKLKMSKSALRSPHRRLRRKMIEYNGVVLDSSWELKLAKALDSMNIKWIRPKPMKWVDLNSVRHNYFADFYLPDYDLYLDPKNPYAMIVQVEKMRIISDTYSNVKFLSYADLNVDSLKALLTGIEPVSKN